MRKTGLTRDFGRAFWGGFAGTCQRTRLGAGVLRCAQRLLLNQLLGMIWMRLLQPLCPEPNKRKQVPQRVVLCMSPRRAVLWAC